VAISNVLFRFGRVRQQQNFKLYFLHEKVRIHSFCLQHIIDGEQLLLWVQRHIEQLKDRLLLPSFLPDCLLKCDVTTINFNDCCQHCLLYFTKKITDCSGVRYYQHRVLLVFVD
jgi:hypothetical protein